MVKKLLVIYTDNSIDTILNNLGELEEINSELQCENDKLKEKFIKFKNK